MLKRSPTSFDAFWRHYKTLHRHPVNRVLHLLGTVSAVGLLGYVLLRRRTARWP